MGSLQETSYCAWECCASLGLQAHVPLCVCPWCCPLEQCLFTFDLEMRALGHLNQWFSNLFWPQFFVTRILYRQIVILHIVRVKTHLGMLTLFSGSFYIKKAAIVYFINFILVYRSVTNTVFSYFRTKLNLLHWRNSWLFLVWFWVGLEWEDTYWHIEFAQ